ncbi:MAG: glycosyltransferase family 4 protein [Polyangiaceae bacterium]|nr:glycosyltransferase family 4 protein [Polyangiaceae bacterium]
MAMANAAGALERKSVLFIVDIDFRADTERYRQAGLSSLKDYHANRFLYDPIKLAQVALAPAYCSLVLLKSAKMVKDFGRGASHVRNFYNTAHSAQHVIAADDLERKLERLGDTTRPLSLVYFGRLVLYKGVDRTIRAFHEARRRSGRALELHLVGGGEQRAALERLAAELGEADSVRFHGGLPFGPQLFELLRTFDVSIATPLVEDTPRAAFDSLAAGLPILAFDIQYYLDLADGSGAVTTSPWEDVDSLATKIIELDRDRALLAAQARRGADFARENTAEIWLDRRVAWTLETLGAEVASLPRKGRRARSALSSSSSK